MSELWARAKRSCTIWVNAAATAIFGWLWFDPGAVLFVWNMMPREVRPLLPSQAVSFIGIVLFALSMAARLRPKAGPKARSE